MGGDRVMRLDRRSFLQGSLALAGAGLLSGCGISLPRAPSASMPRIGYLSINSESAQPAGWLDAFREGMRQAGYIEGQNVGTEYRWADNRVERLQNLAVELAQQNVDVIVTHGTSGVQAAQSATTTIPIVMPFGGDPVAEGFAASLARPGGNITGLTTLTPALAPKRLQLLQECSPGAFHIGVLHDPGDAPSVRQLRETESAARMLGLQVRSLELSKAGDLEVLMARAISERVDALLVLAGAVVNGRLDSIIGVAAQHGLPAMYEGREWIDAGGLLAYGVNAADLYRRTAAYVDQILKGLEPADLPIQRPTAFDFVINLKAAQALGLSIPQLTLQQATELVK
jgi:putative ABC transport system substrate-binding protein